MKVILLLVSVLIFTLCVVTKTIDDLILELSEVERSILDKFKHDMNGSVTHDYMLKDAYLLRFLVYHKFDIERAKIMLLKNVQWRTENRIDELFDEFNPVSEEFPYTEGVDNDGYPFDYVNSEKHNLRKNLIAGKQLWIERAAWSIPERLLVRSRQLNVSQASLIVDLQGFNYRKHACSQCLPLLEYFASTIQNNYPEFGKAIFLINTPRIFQVIVSVAKKALSASTLNVIHIYGYDKQEWLNVLLQNFPSEELDKTFGYNISSHIQVIQEDKEQHNEVNHILNSSYNTIKVNKIVLLLTLPLVLYLAK